MLKTGNRGSDATPQSINQVPNSTRQQSHFLCQNKNHHKYHLFPPHNIVARQARNFSCENRAFEVFSFSTSPDRESCVSLLSSSSIKQEMKVQGGEEMSDNMSVAIPWLCSSISLPTWIEVYSLPTDISTFESSQSDATTSMASLIETIQSENGRLLPSYSSQFHMVLLPLDVYHFQGTGVVCRIKGDGS